MSTEGSETATVTETIVPTVTASTLPAVHTEEITEKPKAAPEVAAEAAKAVEEPQVQPEKKDPLGVKFAALARQKRDLDIREKEVKALYEKASAFEKAQELFKTNPIEGLKAIGMEYKDFYERVLFDQQQDPAAKKLSELEQRLERQAKQLEEERARKEQDDIRVREQQVSQQINAFKDQIRAELTSKVDEYELINSTNNFDTVYSVIEQEFARSQQILPIAKAAQLVEEYLEKEAETMISRLSAVKKLQSKTQSKATQSDAKAKSSSTTLTNQNVASAAAGSKQKPVDPKSLLRWKD